MASLKRLAKEINDWQKAKDTDEFRGYVDIDLDGVEENMHLWKGTIIGKVSKDDPYKGGKFPFTFRFSKEDYPFKAPEFNFDCKIYHPGINEKGEICIALLGTDWRPATKMLDVIRAIVKKLNEPSKDDPFEADIAQVLKDDPSKFNSTAKEWVKKYSS
ncbi:ubiquitin-conjugating enzyme [Schizopora paradoxa]|uniref:Ubiquitin-conjugating enzyme n=1 Tax=Schizopora paradoxa TaxID=27342 RepID=A0A0H2S390_9AGAM|nr:ubiquitin-conjugating enzyme [Schizopora paradoxa]